MSSSQTYSPAPQPPTPEKPFKEESAVMIASEGDTLVMEGKKSTIVAESSHVDDTEKKSLTDKNPFESDVNVKESSDATSHSTSMEHDPHIPQSIENQTKGNLFEKPQPGVTVRADPHNSLASQHLSPHPEFSFTSLHESIEKQNASESGSESKGTALPSEEILIKDVVRKAIDSAKHATDTQRTSVAPSRTLPVTVTRDTIKAATLPQLSPSTIQKISEAASHRLIIHSVASDDENAAEIVDDRGQRYKIDTGRIMRLSKGSEAPAKGMMHFIKERVFKIGTGEASNGQLAAPNDLLIASDAVSPIAGTFVKQERYSEIHTMEKEPPAVSDAVSQQYPATLRRITTSGQVKIMPPAELQRDVLSLKHHTSKLHHQIQNYGKRPTNSKLDNINQRLSRAMKHVDSSKMRSLAFRECVEQLVHMCQYAERVEESVHPTLDLDEAPSETRGASSTERTPLIGGRKSKITERRDLMKKLAEHKNTLESVLTQTQNIPESSGERPMSASEMATELSLEHRVSTGVRRERAKRRRRIWGKTVLLFTLGAAIALAVIIFLVLLTFILVKTAST